MYIYIYIYTYIYIYKDGGAGHAGRARGGEPRQADEAGQLLFYSVTLHYSTLRMV